MKQKLLVPSAKKKVKDKFSVTVSYEDIKNKNYSLSAGQFFEVKIQHVDISSEQFSERLREFSVRLDELSDQSSKSEVEIKKKLTALKYE